MHSMLELGEEREIRIVISEGSRKGRLWPSNSLHLCTTQRHFRECGPAGRTRQSRTGYNTKVSFWMVALPFSFSHRWVIEHIRQGCAKGTWKLCSLKLYSAYQQTSSYETSTISTISPLYRHDTWGLHVIDINTQLSSTGGRDAQFSSETSLLESLGRHLA